MKPNYCKNLKAHIKFREETNFNRHVLLLDNLGSLELTKVEITIMCHPDIEIKTIPVIPAKTSVELLSDSKESRLVFSIIRSDRGNPVAHLVIHFYHPTGFRDDCVIGVDER